MTTKKVTFRLPSKLVEKTDVAAEIAQKDRTGILVEALDEYLDEIKEDEQFQVAVVDLYLDGEIGFGILEEFLGRQNAESIRASKSTLAQGHELADELTDL